MKSLERLPGYMTRQLAAENLGITVRTLDRWNAIGLGPARITVQRLVLYRIEAIEEVLRKNESRSGNIMMDCRVFAA